MELLDQPDNSHHAFKFNKESMVPLLWGHGNQIPVCLKKIINYKEPAREDGSLSPTSMMCLNRGRYSLDKAKVLKFSHCGKCLFLPFISAFCEWCNT